jgi:peptide/nickel transport system ATP-binding protein
MKVHKIEKKPSIQREKAVHLLEKVGLEAMHFDRYPHQFSGGQRQRICIARTLAVDPSFIICDESVSALDVSVQAQVLNLLNDLKNEFNLTYLFISHDLAVVKYMADRMLVMRNGTIVEQGEAEKIYRNPEQTYTKELIEAIPKGIIA